MVARTGENFYRFWSGQRVNLNILDMHMGEGLAQRRAYEGIMNAYKIQWWYQNRVLKQLLVSNF